jgi:hypothetical protein
MKSAERFPWENLGWSFNQIAFLTLKFHLHDKHHSRETLFPGEVYRSAAYSFGGIQGSMFMS